MMPGISLINGSLKWGRSARTFRSISPHTLNGQLPGESYREFKRRLQEDLATLIAGMFYHHQGEAGTRDAMDADGMRIPETAASDRHGIPHNGSDDETDAH